MNKSKILLSISILCAALAVVRSQLINGQEPGQVKASTFMRLKLEPAKGALEGIALADFEMISKNAGKIRNLMLDESWMVIQSDDYRRQSNEFRTIVEQLQKAAEDKNVDRATLAYVQMTIRCVQCHELLRKHSPKKP
jgi:hypothetical protein